ncbi:hypothetical protein Rhopal_002257-T1 [Rhodotorula paludigena]|uniref:HECT-like ubiquitin-conjugating enzyme-binding-domain-containing protein n=1 Tax=Rhodotorula paludigena TaxID=86838 RepID=A0AAV5GGG2_9BASI|nr:hypothetical protein Rhopal_002257-T1 [Rhodotorula paludigena]
MQELQRPLPSSVQAPVHSTFDPSAVPQDPAHLASLASLRTRDGAGQHADEELLALGQEQLFSGTRRAQRRISGSAATASGEAHGRAEPAAEAVDGATDDTTTQLDELHMRVEAVAVEVLPPTEAELARSITSLVTCIERLANISRGDDERSAAPAAAHAALASDPSFSSVAELLDREASALPRSSRDPAAPAEVLGAAREVEQAERDLLWGRVDDLSERVKLLSRRRAEGLQEVEAVGNVGAGTQQQEELLRTPRSVASDSLYDASPSDLPRYSHEQTHLPPAYYLDVAHQSSDFSDDKKEELDLDKLHPIPSSSVAPRVRKVSSATSEKMQRDLDSVTEAIERLYVVSPQLANQRVEPDRRRMRERQLAKLGNAIERLSQGRLEDQRAVPSPIVGEDEDEMLTEAQRLARRAHAAREKEQRAVDRLLDQIDRAASRTLADQRVELNGKRKEVLNLDTLRNDFEPADKYEARRREYILEHTGKGRLASQDAKLNSSGMVAPFPRPPPELDEPVTITEFFAADSSVNDGDLDTDDRSRPRSQSVPAMRKKFSSRSLFQPKNAAASTGEEDAVAPGKKGSLRIGVFKKAPSLAANRRGSYDASGMTGLGVFGTGMSRSASANGIEVLETPQFDWVTEESRNLGTLVVTFWPRASSSSKRVSDDFEVVAVEADSILVGPAHGGPASRLSLPCRIVPQQATVVPTGPYFEVKLVTADSSPTKSRADLEVHTPLSTDDLRRAMPAAYCCTACDAQLVNASAVQRYNALPSEHWAELLDAWMCHQDQTLSDDLVAKGKGIKPRPDEGLVGTTYVLFPREHTLNWVTPDGSESAKASNGDFLHPAHCSSCSALIGSHVVPFDVSASSPTSFRLLKYASYPASLSQEPIDTLRPSLASYLTAEMLETGQAHACHRFVLEDAANEQAKLLLWFFNPAIRVAFSTSSSGTEALVATAADRSSLSSRSGSARSSPNGSNGSSNGSPPLTSSTTALASRSMNAVKVFYAVVSSDSDPQCAHFLHAKHERIPYPAPVLSRLTELLQASTLVYPPAKRKFGELAVGFLERI